MIPGEGESTRTGIEAHSPLFRSALQNLAASLVLVATSVVVARWLTFESLPLTCTALAEVAQLEARTLVIPGDFGCSGRKSSLQQPIRAKPFRQVQF